MVNLPGLTPDGANTSKVFIAIKNGKIIYKDRESGNEYQFKNITGIITGISSHTVTFNNSQQPTDFFDITIKAEDTVYVLSVVKDSGAARQIINSLASVKDFSHTLVIEPWLSSAKSNGEKPYTNVSVYVDSPINENRLKWAIELPKAKEIRLSNGRVLWDNGEQLAALDGLVEEINKTIGGHAAAPAVTPKGVAAGESPADNASDDLPF